MVRPPCFAMQASVMTAQQKRRPLVFFLYIYHGSHCAQLSRATQDNKSLSTKGGLIALVYVWCIFLNFKAYSRNNNHSQVVQEYPLDKKASGERFHFPYLLQCLRVHHRLHQLKPTVLPWLPP